MRTNQNPITDVFRHFHNLNLLVLREDVRRGLLARGNWANRDTLCPLAHGLPGGVAVQRVQFMTFRRSMDAACAVAAEMLGASPATVRRFVQRWDDFADPEWLYAELEAIWVERLEDAHVMQEVLQMPNLDPTP